jgi:Fe-S-cluster-containing dehydrogenase component
MAKRRKKRYAMVIDTRLCIGCAACVVACKTENEVPAGLARDWVVEEVHGTLPNLHLEYRSERCNHCDVAPCVAACPTGASFVDEASNIVLVDPGLCTGCKSCMVACPYDARFIMPEGYASKCTFCMHRVREGQLPACVAVCPTRTMYFGDLNDPESDVNRLLESRLHKTIAPAAGTRPNVYYLT